MKENQAPMKKKLVVALAGNPNSGKTSIFNHLTGSRQHVGNYPGVTVEKKEGSCRRKDQEFHIVDLPGTYSLTAYSQEERIARQFIIENKPDVVVDVLDASNLERNLYLAVQLMELGVPVVLAFNMSDVAQTRGLQFDLAEMSRLLGAPIVETVGNQGTGMDELLAAVVETARRQTQQPPAIRYSAELEQAIERIQAKLEGQLPRADDRERRWTAIKLLEADAEVAGASPPFTAWSQTEQERLSAPRGESPKCKSPKPATHSSPTSAGKPSAPPSRPARQPPTA